MADIILVQPKVGDWDMVRSHPSLPVSLLSAVALAAGEFKIALLDTRVMPDWKTRLKEELDKCPLCVGTTSLTGRQIGSAIEIARFVKENSAVPVVWGGIHASLFPESTISSRYIDFVVQGEGEITFLELARALKEGKTDFSGIKGLWFKRGPGRVGNEKRQFCELDKLPRLPYDLVDMKQYLPKFMGRRTLYFETSRGCPNECPFCYNTNYHQRRWRAQSADKVIGNLIDLVRNKGINSFYFIDDNTFVDLNRAARIAEEIVANKLDIFWEAQGITISSALRMGADYIGLLQQSGLKKVHFGAESGSDRILKSINKKITAGDIREVNRRFKKFDIVVQYNFMSGFPTETMSDIRDTIRLIFELEKENPMAIISPVCPYTPYPGTKFYNDAVEAQLKRREALEDWAGYDYGDNIWASDKKMKLLKALFFSSMFLDRHRGRDMVENRFLKLAINLYRPVAKFRIKNLFFNFMPEMALKEKFFYRKDKGI